MNYEIIIPDIILTSMMKDKELVRQFVEMYLTQSPDDFRKLEASITEADLENIRNYAHHIKPTMTYIGAELLHQNFQELEDLARVGDNFPEIQRKFDEIKALFEKMLAELRFFLLEMI